MYQDAIEKVLQFTRPLHTIIQNLWRFGFTGQFHLLFCERQRCCHYLQTCDGPDTGSRKYQPAII